MAKEPDYAQLIQTTNITNQRINDLKSDLNQFKVDIKEDMRQLKTELKEDIKKLETELKGEIKSLKTDVSQLRTEMKTDMSQLRTEMKTDMSQLKTELKADIDNNRSSINGLFYLLISGFVTMITGIVILYLQNKKGLMQTVSETKPIVIEPEKAQTKTVDMKKTNNPQPLKNPQQNFDESFLMDMIDKYMKKHFQAMPQTQLAAA
jgi:predicted methyltransferase